MKKDYYYPRKKLAKIILDNIQTNDAMNMTLFKQRRSGKTLFLKNDVLSLTKEREDVICFYFSFMGNKESNINQKFVNNFIKSLISEEKILKTFKNTLDLILSFNLLGNDKISNVAEISQAILNSKNNFDLNQLFQHFHIKFPEKKLFLLLDEFQEIAILEDNEDFIKELRTAIDFNSHFVKVIFTGSSYNKLMSFFNDYNQPFYNFGFHLELEDFDEKFVEHLLTVYFEKTGDLNLKKEILEKWFEKTNKSPYYISETLKIIQTKILFNKKQDSNKLFENEIKKLILFDKELIEKDLVHQNFWNNCSDVEKMILIYLIKNNGKLLSSSFIEIIKERLEINENQKIKNKINYAIKKLIKSEKIIKDKEYKFSDLKLKEWIINSKYFDLF